MLFSAPVVTESPARSQIKRRTESNHGETSAAGAGGGATVGTASEDFTPLPDGWDRVHTEDGAVYYYHRVTRISR